MSADLDLSGTYPYFPIITFLGMVWVLVPSAGHFRKGNSGTLLLIFWIFSLNLIFFVDTIVWHANIRNPHPVWCDIAGKFIYMGPVGLTCSTLCITRKLYKVSRVSEVFSTKTDKRRDLIFDLSVGLGFPLFVAALHYIIQGHRYNLYEDFGCMPAVYPAWHSLPLYFGLPLVLALISAVYGISALRQFMRRRKDLKDLLSSTNSGISADRYIRLMWLSCIDIIIGIPMGMYNLIDAVIEHRPWLNWTDLHFEWWRISYVRRIVLQQQPRSRINIILTLLVYVGYAFVFFLLFGFGKEATASYKNVYYGILKPFGVKRPVKTFSLEPKSRRTLLDRILFRPARAPIASVSASMPTFGGTIGSASRPNPTTATFDWDLEANEKDLVDSQPSTAPHTPNDKENEKDQGPTHASSVSIKLPTSL